MILASLSAIASFVTLHIFPNMKFSVPYLLDQFMSSSRSSLIPHVSSSSLISTLFPSQLMLSAVFSMSCGLIANSLSDVFYSFIVVMFYGVLILFNYSFYSCFVCILKILLVYYCYYFLCLCTYFFTNARLSQVLRLKEVRGDTTTRAMDVVMQLDNGMHYNTALSSIQTH